MVNNAPLELNNSHFPRILLKANYSIILMPSAFRQFLMQKCMTQCSDNTSVGILLHCASRGIQISWEGKAAFQPSLQLWRRKVLGKLELIGNFRQKMRGLNVAAYTFLVTRQHAA
jgi:hypothetical protein